MVDPVRSLTEPKIIHLQQQKHHLLLLVYTVTVETDRNVLTTHHQQLGRDHFLKDLIIQTPAVICH